MLEQLRLISEALPWTIPALIGGGLLGLLTTLIHTGRRSRSDRIGVALLVWCLVLALTVTLSPVRNFYFGVPSVGCNLDVWQPLERAYWFSAGSRPPNIWLFVPAGIGAMLLDGIGRRVLVIGALVALPPGVEFVQDRYPQLKRSCSSQDIVDNWTGLAMGLLAGVVLMIGIGMARLIRRRTQRRRAMRAQAGVGSSAEFVSARALPLHGGEIGGYADFSDFDDTPSSTRWWAQDDDRGNGNIDATRIMPITRPSDETRQFPNRSDT